MMDLHDLFILGLKSCSPVWKSTSSSGARQFFTKSFLGDDAAVLALSRGEESITAPASRRRVDGVEDDTMIQHDRAVKF